ncbi:class I SAM-dependent methyltransferase [Streptacidiphilus rugosus]|uniref:class I SAM-dependent methyltransferase n=1 Tax=Streptacidiphilus rugosus TaxID=405783 RepID=UPI000562A67F|nr:class I SAM-dependent methyltransferase [Streptacidiphilus rugosus]
MSAHQDSGHAHGHRQGHADHAGGNGHGHRHGSTDIDWGQMAAQLVQGGELQLPVLRGTAARLSESFAPEHRVRRILDIGSGPGVMTCVLAEAFTGAEAVAVDGTPELLEHSLTRAGQLGLGDRVSVLHAELPEGLDRLGEADLVWSSKAVHHLGDQQGALDALAGLLRPGGVLAVSEGGLPMRFLPRDIGVGRPGLQSRIDVVMEDWFAVMRSELPGSKPVVEDWPAMFRAAGLTDVRSFTLLLDLPAPLDAAARTFLRGHLNRARESMGEVLDADDLGTLDLLLDPDAPEGVMHRPDAFLLSATTVVTGVRA